MEEARGMELSFMKGEEKNGDIAFVHKADRVASRTRGPNGYFQMTPFDDDEETKLANPDSKVDAAKGASATVAAPVKPKLGPIGFLWSEVSITCTRAVESWIVFLDEFAEMRATMWRAVGGLVLWGLPATLAVASMLLQSLSARLATLYYIRYMERIDLLTANSTATGGLPGVDPLSPDWIRVHHLDYPQKLQDIFASFVEPVYIPAYVWDITLFPFTLLCIILVLVKRDVYMWTKLCVCFVMLDVLRAICHVSTVVPDSQGWESCKERLTNYGARPDALEEMRHMDIDWRTAFGGSVIHIVEAEAKGMRYCADMVFSGGAFVLLLFSLGIIEVLRRQWPENGKTRAAVGLLAISSVLVTAVGTLAARYHYTLDVVLALVLTGLWYDSSSVAAFCGWWASLVDHRQAPKVFVPNRETAPKLSTFGVCTGLFSYLLELAMSLWVAWDFYVNGRYEIAMIYLGLMSAVSFVLIIFSFLIFTTDPDLSKLPVCVRFPLSLFLGSTHLIYVVTQMLSLKRGAVMDESFVIKIFKACLQSAPLAVLQLHSLVSYTLHSDLQHTSLTSTVILYKRYIQMLMAFYNLGEAVALFDGLRSSVFDQLLRNMLWRTLLVLMRAAEVTSRISLLVLFHCFMEELEGFKYGIPVLVSCDFILAAILVRCMGVAKKFLAVSFLALISLTSNVYLFQKDEERRRTADMLLLGRTGELFVFFAGCAWYFKFYPGGMHLLLQFASFHKGSCSLLVISSLVYLLLLAVWLEIRRVHVPREWDDQEQGVELDDDA
uniref:Sphingomyelin synthase-like domain-containing protein n=1 Tax=Zooxanthella nutricula TaxID=1333877 RepID=A0A6U6V2T3_9DINO|mmetsp:Transcript_87267/g.267098  ORF Transcript_87267/g.267098 Transcript_87267/m.267098 type:complete len:777 (+) Transcript_87267:67-2397(+)